MGVIGTVECARKTLEDRAAFLYDPRTHVNEIEAGAWVDLERDFERYGFHTGFFDSECNQLHARLRLSPHRPRISLGKTNTGGIRGSVVPKGTEAAPSFPMGCSSSSSRRGSRRSLNRPRLPPSAPPSSASTRDSMSTESTIGPARNPRARKVAISRVPGRRPRRSSRYCRSSMGCRETAVAPRARLAGCALVSQSATGSPAFREPWSTRWPRTETERVP